MAHRSGGAATTGSVATLTAMAPKPDPGPARQLAATAATTTDDDDGDGAVNWGGGSGRAPTSVGGVRRRPRPETATAMVLPGGDGGSSSSLSALPAVPAHYPAPRLLARPNDARHLTRLVCLVRQNLEVFVATPADLNSRTARGGLRDQITPGRVGIRCVHCARRPPPREKRVRCAMSYPRSIRLVYQSVRNWQRHHFWGCPVIPAEVKDEYGMVKGGEKQRRSGNASAQYWEDGCREMGLVDTDGENGIRLRGRAFVGDSGGEVAGREETNAAAPAASAPVKSGRSAAGSGGAAASAKSLVPAKKSPPSQNAQTQLRRSNIVGGNNSHSKKIALSASMPNGGKMAESGANSVPSTRAGKVDDGAKAAAAAAASSGTARRRVSAERLLGDDSDDDPENVAAAARAAATFDAAATKAKATTMTMTHYRHTAVASGPATTAAAAVAAPPAMLMMPTGCLPLPPINRKLAAAQETQNYALATPAPCDIIQPLRPDGEAPRRFSSPAADAAAAHAECPAPDSPWEPDPLPEGGPRQSSALGAVLEAPPHAIDLPACAVAGNGGNSGSLASLARTSFSASHNLSQSLDLNPTGAGSSAAVGSVVVEENLLFDEGGVSSFLNAIAAERGGGAFSPGAASLVSLSAEDVLERARLATSVVSAVGQIRELGDGSSAPREDLRSLGAELYELFAGRPPLDEVDDDDIVGELNDAEAEPLDSGDPRPWRRKKKKEKRPAATYYTPLSELGMPPLLCCLVSSLLDSSSDQDGEEEELGFGDGGRCKYASADEVEADLRLMTSDPGRFLFAEPPSGIFSISQDALHGRAEEIALLLEAFRRATAASTPYAVGGGTGGSSEMVLVSGYSGTGKSCLVRNVRSCFVERGARFITGKFDAMRQMQPLSAVVSALDDYCGLLANDSARIDAVKVAVSNAVGSEGRVLVNLIPNLGRIIDVSAKGDASSMQVSGREALQRLVFLFQMLLRSTCSLDSPIVMFLDDLQWADEVSAELMHALIADVQIKGLLFVGCYRDKEMAPDAPFMVHLNDIRRLGYVNITPIHLSNLDVGSVNSLVAEILRTLPRMAHPLAEAVHHKTGGNALFVAQLLSSLHDEGLLRFALTIRRWEWDMAAIRARNIAENVVELMTAKFLRLAPEVHDSLRIAAGFGAQCQEDLLRVLDRAPGRICSVTAALDIAVAEGLMARTGTGSYRFAHDQIQRAGYLLIPEADRPAFHLRIGRLLWEHSSAEELDAFLYVIVDQLQRGCSLIRDRHEKVNLARLCLRAGQKATSMSAFLPASVYLKAGICLLSDEDWDSYRDLCLNLFDSCAEAEYILGEFEEMKDHLEQVLKRARNLKEKLRAYYTMVQSLGARGHTQDAISTAITVLGHLGESFPSTVTALTVQQELLTMQALLGGETEDALLRLRPMQDSEKLAAMRFLYVIIPYFFSERKEYFPLMASRMIQLSLSHGLCRQSAFAFACYGMVICGLLGDRAGGYRLGKLALVLLDRFKAKESFARTHSVVYGFVFNWTEPLQSSLPCHKDGIQVGLSVGDTEYAMINAQLYLGTALSSGQALGPLMDEMRVYSKQMVEYKHHFMYTLIQPLYQAALNLLGRSPDPVKLSGEEMNEDDLLRTMEDDTNVTPLIHFYRLWLAYLFGRYDLAAEVAEQNRGVEKQRISRFAVVCNHTFYSGLTSLALARRDGDRSRDAARRMEIIDNAIAQMTVWADSTPWNCRHKLELLNAERAYLEGDIAGAAVAYDGAVTTAAKHRFVHEQALALERSGIFYLENNDATRAAGYFVQAKACYSEWGAQSKAAHVQECYL